MSVRRAPGRFNHGNIVQVAEEEKCLTMTGKPVALVRLVGCNPGDYWISAPEPSNGGWALDPGSQKIVKIYV